VHRTFSDDVACCIKQRWGGLPCHPAGRFHPGAIITADADFAGIAKYADFDVIRY
jgi:hypothetical protein